MPKREVDKRKTAKALRKLRKVAERTQAADAPKLTAWEQEFVSGVSQRLETYGSAFRDLSKGRAEEALSMRQSEVARVIEKKSRPKVEKAPKPGADANEPPSADRKPKAGGLRRTPFRNKAAPVRGPRVRDINDDPAGGDVDRGDVDGASAAASPHNSSPTPRRTTQPSRKPARAPQKLDTNTQLHPTPAPPPKPGQRPSLRLIPGGKGGD